MEWQVVLASVLAVPVILIPVALVCYINAGGIHCAIKEARAKKTVRNQEFVANTGVKENSELISS